MNLAPQLSGWLHERTEWVAFVVAFAVFALMAAPGITWMDSGELAAAAYNLGGAHPPGHPVHSLLGKLATLFPFGEIAWRINLLSALTMALAVAGTVALMRALVRDAHPALWAAAALLIASPVVQLNATRTEVYGPTVAALMWSAVALLCVVRASTAQAGQDSQRRADGRYLLLAALGAGLAAACHPLIAACALLPMAALAGHALRARLWRLAPAALGLGILGLCAYLYLPIRANAAHPPLLMWKDPASASALWELLTAPEYQGNFSADGLGQRLIKLSFIAADGNGAGLFWGGVAGLLFAALTGLRGAGTVAAGAMFALVGAAAQSHFNPDMPGYVTAALMFLAAGLAPLHGAITRVIKGSLPDSLGDNWRQRSGLLAGVALLPIVGFGLLAPTVHIEDAGFRRGDDPARFCQETLERMPPGPGLFLGNHDHSLFTAQYERLVAGNRPDIAIANADMVRDRWFLAHVKKLQPALYVPYIDDGARGSLAARLVAGNVRHGRPVAGDQPVFGQLKVEYTRPLGRGYQYFLQPVAAQSLPPAAAPPKYRGGIGARVSGRIAVDRGHLEMARGRLLEALVALGGDRARSAQALSERPAAVLTRAPMIPHLPRLSPRFIYEPWERDLALDEVQWLAELPAEAPAEDAVPERQTHARWRQLLTDPSQFRADTDGLSAAMQLGALSAQRADQAGFQMAAQFFTFATELAPSDPEPWVRLGIVQLRDNRPQRARASWTQALKLAPGRRDVQAFLDELSDDPARARAPEHHQ